MPDLRRRIREEIPPYSKFSLASGVTDVRIRDGLAEVPDATPAEETGRPFSSAGNERGRSYGRETFLASGSSRDRESFADSFKSDFASEIGEMAAALGFKSQSVNGSRTEPALMPESRNRNKAPVENFAERLGEDVSPLIVEASEKFDGVSEETPTALSEESSIFSFL